jgi:predicted DNA-binding transcriptional regulator YafY
MIGTSARLLRLLSLLQMTRTWTGPELARELGVSERTVRKDVDRLRSLGYPVEATRGAVGGYRLGVGGSLPPLLLDDDEAVAVVIGLGQVANTGISGTEAAAQRAAAKIEEMLPQRLRRRVSALRSNASAVPPDSAPDAIDAGVLACLATASREHEALRIGYTAFDGTVSRRTVEPHHLVNWGRRWYLVAWDRDRDDWRTFRVDRIGAADPTALPFTPRGLPDADITAYIALNVARAAWRYRATVVIAASVEEVLAEINPAVGVVEPIDGRTCLLRTGGDSLWEIAVHLALFRYECRVAHPPELKDELRRAADRALAMAGGGESRLVGADGIR